MDCNAYRIFITGYIDGELSNDEMHMLKTHLHVCKPCFAYLTRAEAMKTVMKRGKLLQDIPEVPINFAQTVTSLIQETVQQERSSLPLRILQNYRNFVLDLVERWTSSLRARPFAWVTSISCLLVLIAGVVFVDVFQTVYEQHPVQYTQLTVPSADSITSQTIQDLETLQDTELALETHQGLSKYLVIEGDTQPVHGEAILAENSDRQPLSQGISLEQLAEQTEFIKFADTPVIRIAKTDDELVDNYVYSHVLEAAQEHFLDDALFVGYVQDALR